MPVHRQKGGGSKKIGRNKEKCERYHREGREAKNKARNMATQKRREEKARAKKDRRIG